MSNHTIEQQHRIATTMGITGDTLVFLSGMIGAVVTAILYWGLSAIIQAIDYKIDTTLVITKLRLHATCDSIQHSRSCTIVPDDNNNNSDNESTLSWFEWKGDPHHLAMDTALRLFLSIVVAIVLAMWLYYPTFIVPAYLIVGVCMGSIAAIRDTICIVLVALAAAIPTYIALRMSLRFRIMASMSCDVTKRLRLILTLDHTNGLSYKFMSIGADVDHDEEQKRVDTQRKMLNEKYLKTRRQFMLLDERDVNEIKPLHNELIVQLADIGYDVLHRGSRTYLAYNGRLSLRAEFATSQRLYLTQKYVKNNADTDKPIDVDIEDINDTSSPLFEENVEEFRRMGFDVSYQIVQGSCVDEPVRQMRLQPINK